MSYTKHQCNAFTIQDLASSINDVPSIVEGVLKFDTDIGSDKGLSFTIFIHLVIYLISCLAEL